MDAPVHDYKFRAELLADTSLLRRLLPLAQIEIEEISPLGDVEVTIRTTASIDELSEIFGLIPDGHVMVETLTPLSAYTGKRTFAASIPRQN